MVINNSVDPLNVLCVQQRISLCFKDGGSLNKKHNQGFVYTKRSVVPVCVCVCVCVCVWLGPTLNKEGTNTRRIQPNEILLKAQLRGIIKENPPAIIEPHASTTCLPLLSTLCSEYSVL